MMYKPGFRLWVLGLLLVLATGFSGYAEDKKDFPDKPAVLNAVNDLAGMMNANERAQLEEKLREFERTTSNEITIVTITSIGDYDVADYAIRLGKQWQLGKAGKNNGVLILAALDEHKITIQVGKGLEGALTDLISGRIIRNEMVPLFKKGFYFQGFSKGTDAVISATKGEYKADPDKKAKHMPLTAIILLVIFVIFILKMFRGGGGGGNYMSGRGNGFVTGMLLGSMLGGGRSGGGGFGGGGDSGFGGFGGGGDFGGGGASGSW